MDNKKLEEIMSFLKSLKGIKSLKILTEAEKREALRREESAEKTCLMGLMPGINKGVREALSRTFTISATTTDEFEWPEKGTVKFVYKGEVIGEEIRCKEELERLRREGNRIIGEIFVIYDEKLRELGVDKLRDCVLVIAPLELPWVEKLPHAKHVVVGSPSVPTDLYLKRIMGAEEEGGTIIVGFEL
ncbi:MAG: hypothetical protein PWQ22_1367 [Archaeoglobaceae archaeon]|nr:hypothetical protein [Archaeoglobaceae archaeon]